MRVIHTDPLEHTQPWQGITSNVDHRSAVQVSSEFTIHTNNPHTVIPIKLMVNMGETARLEHTLFTDFGQISIRK